MLPDSTDRDRRRAQGLMIGGIVTLSVGIGIGVFLSIIASGSGATEMPSVPTSSKVLSGP